MVINYFFAFIAFSFIYLTANPLYHPFHPFP